MPIVNIFLKKNSIAMENRQKPIPMFYIESLHLKQRLALIIVSHLCYDHFCNVTICILILLMGSRINLEVVQ